MSCTYKQSSCCLPTEERKCFFKQQINNFGYIFLWESYSPLFISGRQKQCDGRQKMTDYGWLKQEKINFLWFFVVFLECKQTAQQCCQKVWGKSSQILENLKRPTPTKFWKPKITSSKLFQKEKISSSKHKGIKSKLVLNQFLTISLKVAKIDK